MDLTIVVSLIGIVSAKDILWLPIGDSITWGCGTDAGPRAGI